MFVIFQQEVSSSPVKQEAGITYSPLKIFVLKPLTSRSEYYWMFITWNFEGKFRFFFLFLFNFPSNFKLLTRKVTVTIVKVTSQRVLLSDDKYSCVTQQHLCLISTYSDIIRKIERTGREETKFAGWDGEREQRNSCWRKRETLETGKSPGNSLRIGEIRYWLFTWFFN